MEQPAPIEELRVIEEKMRFPDELAATVDTRLAQLAEMFELKP